MKKLLAIVTTLLTLVACNEDEGFTRGEFPVHVSCNVPNYKGYSTIFLNNNTTAPIFVHDTGYEFESIHDIKADTTIYTSEDKLDTKYYGIKVYEERWIEVRYDLTKPLPKK